MTCKKCERVVGTYESEHISRVGLCDSCFDDTPPEQLECKPEDGHDDNNVVCPHCGYAYQPECGDVSDQGEDAVCDHCGNKYTMWVNYTWTYRTTAKGAP